MKKLEIFVSCEFAIPIFSIFTLAHSSFTCFKKICCDKYTKRIRCSMKIMKRHTSTKQFLLKSEKIRKMVFCWFVFGCMNGSTVVCDDKETERRTRKKQKINRMAKERHTEMPHFVSTSFAFLAFASFFYEI